MKEYEEEGFLIKIGSNAKENDILLKESKQNYIWLHLYGLPSPHGCIINMNRSENGNENKVKEVPISIIKLAAYYVKENSKKEYRYVNKVEYIKYKYVKKGSKPGEVILIKKPNIIRVR